MPGEPDEVADLVGRGARRRVDHGFRRRVAGGDRDRCGVGRALAVRDLELRRVGPCGAVGVARLGRRGVAEGPVPVQVPGVGQRAALGVGRARAVEAQQGLRVSLDRVRGRVARLERERMGGSRDEEVDRGAPNRARRRADTRANVRAHGDIVGEPHHGTPRQASAGQQPGPGGQVRRAGTTGPGNAPNPRD